MSAEKLPNMIQELINSVSDLEGFDFVEVRYEYEDGTSVTMTLRRQKEGQ